MLAAVNNSDTVQAQKQQQQHSPASFELSSSDDADANSDLSASKLEKIKRLFNWDYYRVSFFLLFSAG